MFVIQIPERNIFDQRGLEHILHMKYNIKTIRKTLCEMNLQAHTDLDDKLFWYVISSNVSFKVMVKRLLLSTLELDTHQKITLPKKFIHRLLII